MRVGALVFLVLLGLSCFGGGERRCEAQKLAQDEFMALKRIASKLKKEWNFSVDPCSGDAGWQNPYISNSVASNVNCSCNVTVFCHITSIELKSQNLTGELPPELANLTGLTSLDLSRNYLNGSIPAAWDSLPLTNLTLLGNRISGRIPDELGNMSTLQSLVLEDNQLEGPIPATLGKLAYLSRLFLTGNNFSGKLPESLVNLKNMVDMDLSFNNLSGVIPNNFAVLADIIKYMFLTNNMLEGPVPDWIFTSKNSLDLSYNNFTVSPANCQRGNVNLVANSTESSSTIPCLRRNLPCSENLNYNFFINCGGPEVTIGNETYEADDTPLGAANYGESKSGKWAYSSTGYFIDKEKTNYIAINTPVLNMSYPQLYTRARLSPLSLKYYGLCLQNGSYNVSLHFAEIIFTDDQTFSSVGRRVFDVSIQVAEATQKEKKTNPEKIRTLKL